MSEPRVTNHTERNRQIPPPHLVPPLKWAGGKRWLVPTLRQMWQGHTHRRLVEPFVGGMAVALGLRPRRALLNDANCHLINFYRWLQQGLVIDMGMANDESVYYGCRARFNELILQDQDDSKEAAALFYYLNRTGYNGLCRYNSKGKYNVPFGRHNTINYVSDFCAYADALSRWVLTCVDFQQLDLRPGDFVYADPPYDVEFTSYSAGGFGWDDQVRLAEWLARHRGPVVASNQGTERIKKLYRRLGFDIRMLKGPRRISCNGDRRSAQEVLVTKGI